MFVKTILLVGTFSIINGDKSAGHWEVSEIDQSVEYFYSNTGRNFTDALEFCEQLDGEIIKFTNLTVLNYVQSKLKVVGSVFIWANRSETVNDSGTFELLDYDRNVTSLDAQSWEINDSGSECMSLELSASATKWYNKPCTSLLGFVCERQLTATHNIRTLPIETMEDDILEEDSNLDEVPLLEMGEGTSYSADNSSATTETSPPNQLEVTSAQVSRYLANLLKVTSINITPQFQFDTQRILSFIHASQRRPITAAIKAKLGSLAYGERNKTVKNSILEIIENIADWSNKLEKNDKQIGNEPSTKKSIPFNRNTNELDTASETFAPSTTIPSANGTGQANINGNYSNDTGKVGGKRIDPGNNSSETEPSISDIAALNASGIDPNLTARLAKVVVNLEKHFELLTNWTQKHDENQVSLHAVLKSIVDWSKSTNKNSASLAEQMSKIVNNSHQLISLNSSLWANHQNVEIILTELQANFSRALLANENLKPNRTNGGEQTVTHRLNSIKNQMVVYHAITGSIVVTCIVVFGIFFAVKVVRKNTE